MSALAELVLAHKIISALVALVVLIFAYAYFRESPGKHLRKAIKYHKKGEAYYNSGDIESAEDFYGAAEYHREKARELREV